MNVLIVAEFLDDISNPSTYNSRFLTIADEFVLGGHSVRIVTTDFVHSLKKHVSGVTGYKNCEVVTLHETGYTKNVSLKRFRSHKVLSKNLKKWLKSQPMPDVIYSAVPSLDFAFEAAKFAKKNNIKFILDIQDLWPEAFKMVLNIPIVSDLIFAPMARKANKIYECADCIVGVSKTYTDRAAKVNKKAEKTVVFLGTDMKTFDSYKNSSKKSDELTIAYIGTLGHSYDLETMLRATSKLSSQKEIKVLVMGDGPLRSRFEEIARELSVNAEFTGKLPYDEMVARLTQCDIAVNPIKKGSAGSIINKVGDYAMAGLPVVNSQEAPEYRSLLAETSSGINCNCEDTEDMRKALQSLVDDEEQRIEMGKNSRIAASLFFDRARTYKAIADTLN